MNDRTHVSLIVCKDVQFNSEKKLDALGIFHGVIPKEEKLIQIIVQITTQATSNVNDIDITFIQNEKAIFSSNVQHAIIKSNPDELNVFQIITMDELEESSTDVIVHILGVKYLAGTVNII